MPEFSTFDLGAVMQQAAALNAAKDQSRYARLRDQSLELEMQLAREQEARAAGAFTQQSASSRLRDQALMQNMQQGAGTFAQQTQQFNDAQQLENTRLLNMAATEVAENPTAFARWLPQLTQAGVFAPGFDPSQVPPEQLMQEAEKIRIATGAALESYTSVTPAGLPAEVRAINELTRNMSPEDRDAAIRTRLGLDSRAGQFRVVDLAGVPTLTGMAGGQPFSVPLSDLQSEAGAAQTLAGAERSGTEAAITAGERERIPIDAERAGAEAAAKAAAERQVQNSANQRTLEVWTNARDYLSSALEGTLTGPITGRLPALTSEQQSAEGAVAAMAPILKQVFRVAGEGVFTDRDQELLLRMIPQRTAHPETRRAQLEMINTIIESKLSALPEPAQPETAGGEAGMDFRNMSDDELRRLAGGQ